MPLIEKRYAEALIDMTVESGEFDRYINDFKFIVDIYNSDEDFRNFLLNPKYLVAEKQEVIKNVFGSRVKIELVNYIDLLLGKGRIKFLPGIFDEYLRSADKCMNTLNITIISASPLDDAQIELIKEKYRKLHKSTYVKANVEIDKNIMGGLKIKIGDKMTDGSVKGRLESLRKILISN